MGRLPWYLSGAAVGLLVVAAFSGPLAEVLSPLVNAQSEPPVSTMDPLPEYVQSEVVYANYTSSTKRGSIRWTELWYQRDGSGYSMYAPPWNPSGRWIGSPPDDVDHDDDDGPSRASGTIPFDTFFTGGEGAYDFYTIAVARKHLREPPPDLPKASTFVDMTPPEVFVSRPAADAWATTPNLTWSATDAASGVDAVAIALDDAPVGGVHPARGTLTLEDLGVGAHAVDVQAADLAGNTRAVRVPFSFDPNAPAVQFLAPAPGAYLDARTVSLSWTAADSASGIDHFSMVLDAGPAQTLSGRDRARVLEDVPEGAHVVGLTAVDTAGNIASASLSFTVDVSPPLLAILAPVNGSFVAGRQLSVLWGVDDSVSGLAALAVALDFAAPVEVVRAGAYTFPNVGEGGHTVTVAATDRAGNRARGTVDVVLDATPPELAVLTPSVGIALVGAVRVTWRATDTVSGLAEVALGLDGRSPLDVTAVGEFTYAALPVGPHAIAVTATDRAGNAAEQVVPFSVAPETAAPAGVPSSEFWAIVAIMAIAGFTFWAVRQRVRGSGGR